MVLGILLGASAVTHVSGMDWDTAYAKAGAILQQMSREEKNTMLRSSHMWETDYYIGHVEGNDRLGIPPLKSHDNGNGFRANKPEEQGKSTMWPSALALAATFDTNVVRESASALGKEFLDKGANTILGPVIEVHRTAKGGRSFETLSGEDPYLGAKLGKVWIEAVQEQGVIATMKHFVFNDQELNRGGDGTNWPYQFNAIVDDKTAWEIYYEPFRAAVEVGVGSVLCSYNKINDVSACGNQKVLKDDLKDKMGFKGFVVSDWGGERDLTTTEQGLDIDMQDSPDSFNYSLVSDKAADEAVTRTLASMY